MSEKLSLYTILLLSIVANIYVFIQLNNCMSSIKMDYNLGNLFVFNIASIYANLVVFILLLMRQNPQKN